MQLDVTDHLICPSCVPEGSLVLLVLEMRDRRVHRGWLGCPRCGVDYPVEGGLADLRSNRSTAATAPEPYWADELALKIAACVGLTEGPAFVYVAPPLASAAPEVADLVPGIEWVTAGAAAAAQPERSGVSRLLFDGPRLPMASGRMRGAVLARPSEAEVREAARILWPGARLVAFGADGLPEALWSDAGLDRVAQDATLFVGQRRFG